MTADEIECIEEGGTEPTIACSGGCLPLSTRTCA
jgi:nitrogenase subunit NifH